jgi:hypothetical protein
LNKKVYLKKFDAKAQKGLFLGYSERSKAYSMYNSKTQCVEESMHIKFDNKEFDNEMSKLVESFADIQLTKEASKHVHTLEFDVNPEGSKVDPTSNSSWSSTRNSIQEHFQV